MICTPATYANAKESPSVAGLPKSEVAHAHHLPKKHCIRWKSVLNGDFYGKKAWLRGGFKTGTFFKKKDFYIKKTRFKLFCFKTAGSPVFRLWIFLPTRRLLGDVGPSRFW